MCGPTQGIHLNGENTPMMPAPTHLKGIVVPRDAAVDEQALSADLRCPCGGDVFDLLYPGQTHEYRGELIPCTAEIGDITFSSYGRDVLIAPRTICCWMATFMDGTGSCATIQQKRQYAGHLSYLGSAKHAQSRSIRWLCTYRPKAAMT